MAKKKTEKKKERKIEPSEQSEYRFETPTTIDHPIEQNKEHSFPKRRFPSITTMVIFLLLGFLLGLFFAYRGMPVAAIINGQPVFRWELANVLFQRYGDQTLQGLITEKLIANEAQKSSVSITQSDIDEKAKQILSSFGNSMTVEDFLKFQGMEKTDFDNQIKLQLTVEKLLSKDLVITDQEVAAYIASNQASLVATDPAQLREEAKNLLRDEKISEKIQTWLEDLKAKASITSFL